MIFEDLRFLPVIYRRLRLDDAVVSEFEEVIGKFQS